MTLGEQWWEGRSLAGQAGRVKAVCSGGGAGVGRRRAPPARAHALGACPRGEVLAGGVFGPGLGHERGRRGGTYLPTSSGPHTARTGQRGGRRQIPRATIARGSRRAGAARHQCTPAHQALAASWSPKPTKKAIIHHPPSHPCLNPGPCGGSRGKTQPVGHKSSCCWRTVAHTSRHPPPSQHLPSVPGALICRTLPISIPIPPLIPHPRTKTPSPPAGATTWDQPFPS